VPEDEQRVEALSCRSCAWAEGQKCVRWTARHSTRRCRRTDTPGATPAGACCASADAARTPHQATHPRTGEEWYGLPACLARAADGQVLQRQAGAARNQDVVCQELELRAAARVRVYTHVHGCKCVRTCAWAQGGADSSRIGELLEKAAASDQVVRASRLWPYGALARARPAAMPVHMHMHGMYACTTAVTTHAPVASCSRLSWRWRT
jgi:hypothetical protein